MSDLLDDKIPIKYVLIGESTSIKIITEFTSGTPDTKTKKEINRPKYVIHFGKIYQQIIHLKKR